MSRSVVVFLWSAVLVQVWMGASCAAVETANTAVATEAQVTVDGDTSHGYTSVPVPAVRQYEEKSSSDDPSDDSTHDSADDDWERSEETVTQLKNGSICEDLDENCDKLLRHGNWCVDNIEYMTKNCPVTCGICEDKETAPMQKENDDNCEDLDSACGWLARVGRCDTEATFMAERCPLSCGLCVPRNEEEDEDEEEEDEDEEVGGEFRTSRDIHLAEKGDVPMQKEDDENCEDLHIACGRWARRGRCDIDDIYMAENCPLSCDLCVPHTNLKEQEAEKHGLWTEFRNSREKYVDKKSDASCVDDDEHCNYWAGLGECETNAAFMLEGCRKSCKVCGVDKTYGVEQEAEGPERQQVLDRIVKMKRYMKNVVAVNPKYKRVKNKCENLHELCVFWAVVGECESNPENLKIECAPACQTLNCEHLE